MSGEGIVREPHAGGAATMEWVIGGRVMTHPRHGVLLYTVYSKDRGRQPGDGTGNFLPLPDPAASA